MNIFVLDEDPKKCAQYHANTHVVKMVTETAQLLSSAFYYTDEQPVGIYSLTHKNHPCAKWVRASLSNWLWTKELGIELYKEYQYRYFDGLHKAGDIILGIPTPNIKDIGLTPRPQAMPSEFMNIDPVVAYRNYYIGAKSNLLKYTKREMPLWLKEAL